MNNIEKTKILNICPPVAIVDNAAIVSAIIDTLGYDHLTIVGQYGVTDIATVALKVQESTASNMASPSDVPGTVVGTDLDAAGVLSVLPSATFDTGSTGIVVFEIPCGAGRKRYLDLVATFGDGAAGTFFAATAHLSKAGEVPVTAAQRGIALYMRGT